MHVSSISFRETGYFSDIICDYLEEKETLKPFYGQFPRLEDFKKQIEAKKTAFPQENRVRLSRVLQTQYQHIAASALTLQHIEKLKESNTFTVTTGHQLNIFTGPLYFFYKIVSTINLARQLKDTYPEYHFVPVYWMATEDHDFEEINYFKYEGKKLEWNRQVSGAVGRLSTEGMDEVFTMLETALGIGKHADDLKKHFKEAYLKHHNLADATRHLVNALFGAYGLVIIDADSRELKQEFIPYIEDELQNETSFKAVNATIAQLKDISANYKIQVQPRACNLFYLEDGIRERIIREQETYYVNDTTITFTAEEIQTTIKKYPERFSPNVITRPLYQEVILPNLCYIGGGGELAYWLELKTYFKAVQIPFPILMLRNSALIIPEKTTEKLKKLHISPQELFMSEQALIHRKIKEISTIPIDFTPQKEHLQHQFKALYELAEHTDKSFLGAVKAQEKKQLNGLKHLEKRLLKAQKRKEAAYVHSIIQLRQSLFPGKGLQERVVNFSTCYMEYGTHFLNVLMNELDPFKQHFLIITL